MARVKVKTKAKAAAPCYEGHRGMPLLTNRPPVRGGTCLRAPKAEVDTFVGLDGGMMLTARRHPWVAGQDIYLPIKNMMAPSDTAEAQAMIRWLVKQVREGGVVHIGCIGGHGRTGLVLAGMVAEVGNQPDPIAYVRERYCPKAVETKEQVDWLMEHYGAPSAVPRYGPPKKKKRRRNGQTTSDAYATFFENLDPGDLDLFDGFDDADD